MLLPHTSSGIFSHDVGPRNEARRDKREFAPEEANEAHSLIANVAGRVLMLQKDKPAAERGSKKVFVSLLIIHQSFLY